MSFWVWTSRRREKEILELYVQHVAKVVETVSYAYNVMLHYVEGRRGEVEREWSNVFKAEREADEIKRRIIAELSKGIFHPIDREDVLRLIFVTDDIASYAKAWSRRVLLLSARTQIPYNISKHLVEMSRRVLEAVKLVDEAAHKLLGNAAADVLDIADRIERLEEEVDDIRLDALSEVLDFCDTNRASACMLAKELVDLVENAADRCEDVADVLRSIVLMRF